MIDKVKKTARAHRAVDHPTQSPHLINYAYCYFNYGCDYTTTSNPSQPHLGLGQTTKIPRIMEMNTLNHTQPAEPWKHAARAADRPLPKPSPQKLTNNRNGER